MKKFFKTILVRVMANTKMAKIVLVAPIASILMLSISAVPASADSTFIAVINSGQEVPPNESNALGVAFMTFNNKTKELCYSISYTDLMDTERAAHFHAPAAAGVNASVLFPISPSPSRAWPRNMPSSPFPY